MDYLKETVRVDIGNPPGIPVGSVKEYIYLSESEIAKLLYKRLNINRTPNNWLDFNECRGHAKEILNSMNQYIVESPISPK